MNISAGPGRGRPGVPAQDRLRRLPALRRRQGHRRHRGQARGPHAHRRRDPVGQVHRRACPPACRTTDLPLPFAYESTGTVTQFTNGLDPDPRSREVFTFHRPEELIRLATLERQLRANLRQMPRARHRRAVAGAGRGHPATWKQSLAANRPRAADPDGHRQRARRSPPATSATGSSSSPRPSGSCSWWTATTWAGRRSTSSSSSSARTTATSSPRSTTSSTCKPNTIDPAAKVVHHHHPAALLDPQGRGGVRGGRTRKASLFEAATVARQGAAAGRLQPEDARSRRSTSSSSTSATARSTTSGGRCWNTSTPSSIGLTATPTRPDHRLLQRQPRAGLQPRAGRRRRRERRLRRLPHRNEDHRATGPRWPSEPGNFVPHRDRAHPQEAATRNSTTT